LLIKKDIYIREWEEELRKNTIASKDPNKCGKIISLTRAILRAFGPGYMILSLAAMVSEFVFKYVKLLYPNQVKKKIK